MLNLENKILLLFILILIAVSCDNERNNKSTDKIYYEKSMAIANRTDSKNYYKTYNLANDSIKNWLVKLTSYNFLKSGVWELDSLLCFDKHEEKCVMCVKSKCEMDKGCVQDDLHYFYGVKINFKWYFFEGPSVVLPREMYQKDIHIPLTFKKMHEIALKEIFGGYLTPDGEINEDYFKGEFEDSGWGVTSGKKEDFEKVYLEKVNNNWYWAKKDTTTKKNVLP